jgi:4-amino-4-deoxy-L-arabinose transferase-like glycosyltransferase
MTGVIHPYYTNTLAPAIAVAVGVGATILWRRRDLGARLLLATMLIATAVWSYVLLDRTPSWYPWLRYAVLLGALAAAAGICAGGRLKETLRPAVVVAGLLAGLAGPAAYTFSTVANAKTGSTPSAGPVSRSMAGFPGAGPSARAGAVPGDVSTPHALASLLTQSSSAYTWVAASSSAQTAASLELATGKPVMAIGGFSGSDPAITLRRFKQLVAEGEIHYYVADGGGPGGPPQGGLRGAVLGPQGGAFPGGGLRPPASSGALQPQGSGFPPPSGFRPPGGVPGAGPGGAANSVERQIQSWVGSHFSSRTVSGAKVYDLTTAK